MSEIRFYNRYSGEEEVEEVYGESFLRWTYETNVGRAGLWLLAKRALFSRWYGWRMSSPKSAGKVRPFIQAYKLDERLFREPVDAYSSFNDFFYRKLKPEARPVAQDPEVVALPADGRHLGVPNVDEARGLYAKGQAFELESLLGDASLAAEYAGGTAVISRLCPVDYHRFHSPVAGTLVEQRLINGPLYSVSPIALRRSLRYLWENKRLLNVIETDAFGRALFLAIGATCVGTIAMTAKAGEKVAKGGELGYFAFGGSCVITIFRKGAVALSEDLAGCGSRQLEVYAHVGDELGRRAR